jgi:arsenate reductase-like glutaredoxin family protein
LPAEQKQELEKIITETLEQGEEFMRTIADTYREEGLAQGLSQGLEQVAVEMLKTNYSIQNISTITKLSTDQILTLKTKISQ